MNLEINKSHLDSLRSLIENKVERRIKTPSDFDFLATCIREKTKCALSPTTLKRAWGYVRDVRNEYIPGRYTLCVLAKFLGYADIEDFCLRISNASSPVPQSNIYFGESIESDKLSCGSELIISWAPDRKCRIRHISDNTFEVIESINSKLHKGDIVECNSFTQNAPVYFNNISRAGCEKMTYVAGIATGTTFVVVNPE